MSFTTQNRTLKLWATCAYQNVPIFRALALALDHAAETGASFALQSADRRDAVLATFNSKHGTNLHGQQYLFDHQHEPGFFPANTPATSSHCLFADGNAAYRVGAAPIPAGGKLPRWFLGIDAIDTGPGAKANDCTQLVGHLSQLGYDVTRPYSSPSEAHHFSFASDPTPVLLANGRIPSVGTKGTTTPAAAPTAISAAGAEFIAQFEGFVPTIYNDAAQPPNATIGFGHVVHAGPITGNEAVKQVTREQALAMLRKDCAKAAAAVRRHVTQPLTQAQFDALVSFTFNLGEQNLAESTLLKKLNAGELDAVPAELQRWVHAGPGAPLPGLVRRRQAVAALFTNGAY
jgi:lysozyme